MSPVLLLPLFWATLITAEAGIGRASAPKNFTGPPTTTSIRSNNTNSSQYVLQPSGIYVYKNLGKLNETIILPNGQNIDTFHAIRGIPEYFPYYFAGYDREDRPVWVASCGRLTSRNIFSEGLKNEYQFHFLQYLHRCIKSVNQRNLEFPSVGSLLLIYDMEGFATSAYFKNFAAFRWNMEIIRDYRDFFLEIVEEWIYINMNYPAETALTFLKPLLGAAGRKLTAFGTLKKQWVPKLLQKVSKENLPLALGGSANFTPILVGGDFFHKN